MTQNELDRAVAAVTGEAVGEIRSRGFSLAEADGDAGELEPIKTRPSTIDWDKVYPVDPFRRSVG